MDSERSVFREEAPSAEVCIQTGFHLGGQNTAIASEGDEEARGQSQRDGYKGNTTADHKGGIGNFGLSKRLTSQRRNVK